MKNKSKKTAKLPFIIVACAILIAFGALIINNYKTKTSNKEVAAQSAVTEKPQDAVSAAANSDKEALSATRKNSEILKVSASDFVLGDTSAPVVMIEYASLSCPHCSAFHRESFEKLKAEYVDTKKVQFIYRNFPLNQPALAAAMLVNCQAKNHKENASETYYNLTKALFKTQDSWAFDPKYIERLESIAQLDGMSAEGFKTCIDNKDLQEKILSARMEVSKGLQIQSTPSFFVNGEIMEGYVDYLSIKKMIDKKLAEVTK